MGNDEISWTTRDSGYDSEDTNYLLVLKKSGTDPDLTVYQSGFRSGKLTISKRTAVKLISSLRCILDFEEK